MPRCEIALLGRFRVRVDGRPVDDRAWRHRRGAQLVKLLALTPGHRLHREQVIDALWPELDPEAAAANLRKAVHFARRALASEEAILTTREMVELWPGADISVDAVRFETAACTAGDGTAVAEAAALYTGDLLPEDRYASWAEEPRVRLRSRLIDLLRRGALWERLLEIDPANEVAHRALMQRALDAGDRRTAIRQFERLRERLRIDCGARPDEALVRLYEQALAMEAYPFPHAFDGSGMVQLYEKAAVIGGHEPATPAQRAHALLARGIVQLNTGNLEEAEHTADRARALAIDAGLAHEVGEASGLLGVIAHIRGRWGDLFRAEFLASLRRSPEIASSVFDAHLCLAEFSLHGPGGHEQIARFAQELLAAAREAGSVQGRALGELLLGAVDLFSGRLAAAEDRLTSAARLHEQARAPAGRVLAIQRLAELAIARGQRWRARRMIRRGLRLADRGALAPHLPVRLHGTLVEAVTDETAAADVVSQADAALAGRHVCLPCSIGFRVAASMAQARTGTIDAARQRLEDAERIARMWPGGSWHAAVSEARGVLAKAEGDRGQAVALFKEAAGRFAEVGRPRDEARCRAAASA